MACLRTRHRRLCWQLLLSHRKACKQLSLSRHQACHGLAGAADTASGGSGVIACTDESGGLGRVRKYVIRSSITSCFFTTQIIFSQAVKVQSQLGGCFNLVSTNLHTVQIVCSMQLSPFALLIQTAVCRSRQHHMKAKHAKVKLASPILRFALAGLSLMWCWLKDQPILKQSCKEWKPCWGQLLCGNTTLVCGCMCGYVSVLMCSES